MAREVIGHMACPECGGAAEVKKTKAGLAYRWCMDCHAQYFPRTAEASDRLIAKCGGTVTPPAPAPAQEPTRYEEQRAIAEKAATAPEPKPAPKAKAKPPAPAPAPVPKPAPKPGPFDFLFNQGSKA